jgi:3'-5' exoribonuclease
VPGARRDTEDLDGFLEFLAAEIADSTLRALVEALLATDASGRASRALRGVDGHHAYAGGALEHTVAVATICREIAQLHPGSTSRCSVRRP